MPDRIPFDDDVPRHKIEAADDEMTNAVTEVLMRTIHKAMIARDVSQIDMTMVATFTGFCLALARSQAKILTIIHSVSPEYHDALIKDKVLEVSPEEAKAMRDALKKVRVDGFFN